MNKIILLGNVGRDPDIRSVQSGDRVANFSIATSDKWTGADGEKRERTDWHQIVCWNQGLVGVIERFVHKGKQVYVEGTIRSRTWTDQSGNERNTTEVVMEKYSGELVLLGSRPDDDSSRRNDDYGSRGNDNARPSSRATGMTREEALGRTNPIDDDIPF